MDAVKLEQLEVSYLDLSTIAGIAYFLEESRIVRSSRLTGTAEELIERKKRRGRASQLIEAA